MPVVSGTMFSIVVEPSSVPSPCYVLPLLGVKLELCFARVYKDYTFKINLVPAKGLEPSRHKPQEPKSCPSTNSDTPAYKFCNPFLAKLYYSLFGATHCLAADYLLSILLRLSSYSISSLFSEFLLHKSIALMAFSGGR